MIWKLLKDRRNAWTPALYSGEVIVGTVFRSIADHSKLTGRCLIAGTASKAFDTEAEAKTFVEAEFAAWCKRAQLGPT